MNNISIDSLMNAAQYLNEKEAIDVNYLKGMADLIAFVAEDDSNGSLSTSSGAAKHILLGIKGWHRETLPLVIDRRQSEPECFWQQAP